MAIVKIETTSMTHFNERCAKINKKLVKFGYAEVEQTNHTEEYVTYTQVDENGNERNRRVLVHKLDLIIPIDRVGVDGTTFIARLDFGSDEAGNRIFKADETSDTYDEILFNMIKDRKSNCDHCNTNRRRNALYIFKKDEKLVTIGATCAKEWYGIGIENFLKAMTCFTNFCEEERGYRDHRAAEMLWANYFILTALASVQSRGFVGSKFDNSTANEALELTSYYLAPNTPGYTKKTPTLHTFFSENREMINKQFSALQDYFLNGYAVTDLFSSNLRSSIVDSTCSPAMAAIAAQKYLTLIGVGFEAEGKDKAPTETQELPICSFMYLGEIGEKVTLEGEIAFTTTFSTEFGVSYLIKVQGAKGVATWFTSSFDFVNCNYNDLHKFSKVRITGKIKKLDNYKDVPQTILTRCKLELIEEVA
jgi:hypothetical protein